MKPWTAPGWIIPAAFAHRGFGDGVLQFARQGRLGQDQGGHNHQDGQSRDDELRLSRHSTTSEL